MGGQDILPVLVMTITEPYNIGSHEMISITLRRSRASTDHRDVFMTMGICTMLTWLRWPYIS